MKMHTNYLNLLTLFYLSTAKIDQMRMYGAARRQRLNDQDLPRLR